MNLALTVLPRKVKAPILPDEDDQFLLELAITGDAAAIVTGDEALLDVRRVSGVDFISPREFCKKFKLI